MDDPIKALMALVGLSFTFACAGAAFVFGAALVSKWMSWAPVNVTVNLNDYRDQ